MNKVYKYIFVFVLLLTSCSFIKYNNSGNVYDKCGIFDINIKNVNNKDVLFYLKLKTNLEDKFSLLYHNENNNRCIIDIIDTTITNYVPLVDNSGIASRNNKKIDIKYSVELSDKIIKDRVIVFYGLNVSENYYSNYVNSEKVIDNDIDLLSEKIFYSVIKNINKIK